MTTISTNGKVGYIYDQATSTWHPIAGATNTAANFSWSGTHAYGAAVTFSDVVNAKAGVNNFANPAARDAAITSPTNGIVVFVRANAAGVIINEIQYYYNGSWIAVNGPVLLNTQTASYTSALSDANKTINMNVSSANTLTIPPNSSVPYPVGSRFDIVQTGTGQVTVTAGSGVTIQSKDSKVKLTGQYSAATVIKLDTNTWLLIGDLTV